jgi:hypothetical protein
VTADNKTKTYGEADPTLTYQVTSGNLVGSDTLSGALTRTSGEDVNSYTIDASALANGNYLITKQNGTLSISQRPITVTANPLSKVYGASDPTLTFSLEANATGRGIVGTDTFGGALARDTGESVGSNYAVALGSLANSNYTITFIGANFEIKPQPITIAEIATAATSNNVSKVISSLSVKSVALNPTARVSTAGIKVELVQRPELQAAGFVVVSVPSNIATSGAGLAFALPDEFLEALAGSVNVKASLVGGDPLPSWLRFDSNNGQFIVSEVADVSLPIELTVEFGTQQVKVVISESPN